MNVTICWRAFGVLFACGAFASYPGLPPASGRCGSCEEVTMGADRRLISSGSPFEQTIGYSRAVVEGPWAWVSGTTGYNYETMDISDDVVEQADQALANIAAALSEVGLSLDDVVRVRYLLTSRED